MSRSIFILGSCVSRDAFEYPGGELFFISKYLARTSLASQILEKFSDEGALQRIPSKFQRDVVFADMEKILFRSIWEIPFDALVIDFIDDRFPLLVSECAGLTVSSEYADAKRRDDGIVALPSGTILEGRSGPKLELWQKGLDLLLDVVSRARPNAHVIVNRVYWASETYSGESLPSWMGDWKVENAFLDELYRRCALSPQVKFIEYDVPFRSDPNHVWGLSPFHYGAPVYMAFLSRLHSMFGDQATFSFQ